MRVKIVVMSGSSDRWWRQAEGPDHVRARAGS